MRGTTVVTWLASLSICIAAAAAEKLSEDEIDQEEDRRRPAIERTSGVLAIAWSSSSDVSTSFAK